MKRFAIFCVFISLFISGIFQSCKQKVQIPIIEFASYISAYTGGLVYNSSPIRIELANEIASSVELHTEIADKLFSFSPSIKGKAYWVDSRTIEFIPNEGQLKPGKVYEAEFNLGKVVDVENKLKEFSFSFKVEEKNFSLHIHSLNINPSDNKQASISGQIRFSDEVSLDLIKKDFSVVSEEKESLSVIITPTGNSRIFAFSIDNIERKKKDFSVEVSFQGKNSGFKKNSTEKVVIPSLDKFKVLSAQFISTPENAIEITFSDLLSSSQNNTGLIDIPEITDFVYHTKDNKMLIFFEKSKSPTITLKVMQEIENIDGKKLSAPFTASLSIERTNPQVKLPDGKPILPDSKKLILPFQAVNLRAVDIKIVRIYESNILSFLQSNSLNTSNELRRMGRLVYKKTLRLDSDPSKDIHSWQDYSIDLAAIFKQEPGAIYRIEFSFNQHYSAYPCGSNTERPNKETDLTKLYKDEITEGEESYWDQPQSYYYSDYDYNWEEYDWDERENPCHPTFYMTSERTVSCNTMSSNIGVIVKSNSDNMLWVTTNNILDTKPIGNAHITIYDYQLQPIGNGITDENGFAVISLKGKPFVLVAEYNKQKTYVKVVDGYGNSLSRFDVGGKVVTKGLKGYIYGERGVWRPGDTIFLSFILEDPEKKIPANHPVTLEVFNAQGQFYAKQISTQGVNGFYSFPIPTKQDDPTGLWNAHIKVGGATFYKSLRIETIKPNRLKINLDIPETFIDGSKGDFSSRIRSNWLTGATARNLKAKVEMTLSKSHTQFKGYERYIFNNPVTNFYSNETEVFDGNLNEEGVADFIFSVPNAQEAPGMLRAHIVCRVFEPGGDASIFTQTTLFSPFRSYVGINMNQRDDALETDKSHTFDVVTLSDEGKPISRNGLIYKIYKVNWKWWWEYGSDNNSYSSYVNSSSYTPVAQGKLNTSNGKGSFKFKIDYPEWGRYLVYVLDETSGHATGGFVYIDWPEWRGRSQKSDPDGLKMLTFTTDKESYNIGDVATVTIPAASGGKALVSIENGSTVLSNEWVNIPEKTDTKHTFTVTKEMSPNCYVHISLLQPHAQTVNDLPIRMYGIMPIMVSNKNSYLQPLIQMPDVLAPEEEFTVQVKEKDGKPMTYTLAIVDDGLLDLTNFKTPDPWAEFYARVALGITTWDIYDLVMGAIGGKLGTLFSIGGDEDIKPDNIKANRFKPVVKYIGPFTVEAGKTNKHKIQLPMYVGSVRVMVVAGQNQAYGKTEKTVPVRSSLMLLSSLPRVVSIGEEITLPVNVFATDSTVKNATVKIETTGKLITQGSKTQSITFSEPGDKLIYFSLKSGETEGIEKVTLSVSGNGNTLREVIEIDVRNPNPPIIQWENKLLENGQSAVLSYQLTGNSKDNWVKLEASRIPSIDISRRFDFLYHYEHLCTEQITSKVFPLLYVSLFKEMNEQETEIISKNIQEAIRKLYGRQISNGSFEYWPGQGSVNEWITSYVGNFLLAAKEKGYEVNKKVLREWKRYQEKTAKGWTKRSGSDPYYIQQAETQQAYRLYTLALAGSAELGAMNRMKEQKDLCAQARWRLAATYALAGKINAAEELVVRSKGEISSYPYSSYTYGSPIRDEAMILETMLILGKTKEAFILAKKISTALNNESYFSTQSTAFALVAMGRLAEKTSGTIDYSWTLNNQKQPQVKSIKAVYQTDIPTKPTKGEVSITNNNKGSLFVNLISKTKPLIDTSSAIANNLRLDVEYLNLDKSPLNVNELKQGTDFIVSVKVTNINGFTNYEDIALSHIIPSGWEIFNKRMMGGESYHSSGHTYQDIRDDRVLTYFNLRKNQSKTFQIRLQATYLGNFVLPAILCEAMYDTSAQARSKAGRVRVVK